jgi:uncharacterized protein YndB with AHSA1/START domain
MRASAKRELLAPREDVWRFVAEPYHLSDWWPGVAGVEPDRLGLAPGARWRLRTGTRPGGGPLTALLRRPDATGLLLVLEVNAPAFVRLHFVDDRVDAELRLDAAAEDRTRATLVVEGSWLRLSRSLPRQALARLHALVQTAASL